MEKHNETTSLISAGRVQGTNVYNTAGESLGGAQLEKAPTIARNETPNWSDRAYESRLHDYYGIPPYWG